MKERRKRTEETGRERKRERKTEGKERMRKVGEEAGD